MTVADRGKRPPTIQQAVLTEIRRAILGGGIAPGSPIPQDELAAQLGVSRIPVRDALRLLEGEGLVSYLPHHGYQVAPLEAAELRELQRMREILETEALHVATAQLRSGPAAARFPDAVTAEMSTAMSDMDRHESNGDLVAWNEAHRRFHFALFPAATLPRLLRLLHQVWDASDIYRAHFLRTGPPVRAARGEHQAILDAAAATDLDTLATLLHRHRKPIEGWLAGEPAPEPG